MILESFLSPIFKWSPLTDDPFANMLLHKEPLALAVLTYLGVILHWCRSLWIIGDLGRNLVENIMTRLGEEWRWALSWSFDITRSEEETVP
jgi:hypothetical protein